MSRKFSFDELLAKREQREADKLKVGMLIPPGSEAGLEARMPSMKVILELYGELAAASDAQAALACGNHALYACCPQLQDRALQTELGVAENPMSVIDTLFSLTDQDSLGGQALQFLGLLPAGEQAKDPAADTIKN